MQPGPLILADAGTPLMWMELLHLVVGNAVIGLGEGLLVSWLFKTNRKQTVGLMVLANYFSMVTGYVVLSHLTHRWAGEITIYNGLAWLWSLMAASYVASIFLEWPFLLPPLWKRRRKIWVALLASLVAQTASYALLVPFYGSGFHSILTKTRITHSAEFAADKSAVVYFIAAADHRLYRQQLDGSPAQPIGADRVSGEDARLLAEEAKDGSGWDLCLVQRAGGDPPYRTTMSARGIVGWTAPETSLTEYKTGAYAVPSIWVYTGVADVVDLRSPKERSVEVYCRWWAYDGLGVYGPAYRYDRLGMECPFFEWGSRNVSVLPGDQLIYQLGDQIVLLDLPTMRMTLLARGYGPVVFLAKEPAWAAATMPSSGPVNRP